MDNDTHHKATFHPHPGIAFDEAGDVIGAEEFPYHEVDGIKELPPDARQLAAEMFGKVLGWVFKQPLNVRRSTIRLAAVAYALRPDLVGNQTGQQLATQCGYTKQNFCRTAKMFAEAFNLQFTQRRTPQARQHMREAAMGHAPTHTKQRNTGHAGHGNGHA